MMAMVHELPGATFLNPVQRGAYDSDKQAALTLHELQRWLALAVASYHGQVHGTSWQTPAARWAEGITASGVPATVTNESAFLVDFLPVIRRTLTRTGFVIDHIHYFADALKPWIARRQTLDRFVIRRDPRDLSRIWVLGPDGACYLEVPYRTLSHPPVSVWEHRAAAGAATGRGPRPGRRGRPVPDGRHDAHDHRHRPGHDSQNPPGHRTPARESDGHTGRLAARHTDAARLPGRHRHSRRQRRRPSSATVRGDPAMVTAPGGTP
jgi:hypothetical protein